MAKAPWTGHHYCTAIISSGCHAVSCPCRKWIPLSAANSISSVGSVCGWSWMGMGLGSQSIWRASVWVDMDGSIICEYDTYWRVFWWLYYLVFVCEYYCRAFCVVARITCCDKYYMWWRVWIPSIDGEYYWTASLQLLLFPTPVLDLEDEVLMDIC